MTRSMARSYAVTLRNTEGAELHMDGGSDKRDAIRLARRQLTMGQDAGQGPLPASADVYIVVDEYGAEQRILIYQAHWTENGIVVDEL